MKTIVFKDRLYRIRSWEDYTGEDWIRWSICGDALACARSDAQFEAAVRGMIEVQCPEASELLSDFSRRERYEFLTMTLPDTSAWAERMATVLHWNARIRRNGYQRRLEGWLQAESPSYSKGD